jgi:hypothetical protein
MGATLGGPHMFIFVINDGVVMVIQRDVHILVLIVPIDVTLVVMLVGLWLCIGR